MAVLAVATGFVGVAVLQAAPAFAANPAANIDQCANDPAPSDPANGCATSSSSWVNGNLGSSKTVYREGDSIPYRLTFSNLATGNASPHKVTIEWDTTKSGKHALDYIDSYNQSVLDANPCLGVSGCSGAPTSTLNIPADPQVTGASPPVTPIAGKLSMWGGTITSVTTPTAVGSTTCTASNTGGFYCYSSGTGFSGDKSAAITVNFVATVANPVLAWGGHIATRKDWGLANSAVSISGSPYHTRLIDLDGSGGNQDRSLSAEAVLFPGFIHIVKNTVGGNGSFSYTASPSPLSAFTINTVGNTGEKDFDNITNFQTYTVAETGPGGDFAFTSLACTVAAGTANGGSQSVSGQTATIALNEGEEVTCTYVNTLKAAAITLTKSAGTSDVCNGGSDQVTYTYTVKNTGGVALTGSVTDDKIAGTIGSFTNLAAGASTSFTATTTVSGSVTNTGTVTATSAGGQSVSATATSTVTGHDCTITVTKSAGNADVCNGSSVTYTIKVTNNSDKFTWTGSVTDTVNGTLASSLTLAPGASQTYTPSHAITGTVGDTVTASGTFNDSASKSASSTASATVTGHVCTISVTKSPSTTNVCDGTPVTYTIKVTNNSDKFTWTGSVTDTINGTLDSSLTLGPGASQTYTPSHSITGTVSDTVTASGTFNDPATSSASDTASATVTGSPCGITVTKSAGNADVCNGSSVTYTIKVTNNSTQFTWTGTVTDTVNGTLDSNLVLAPGASQTYTPSHAITGTVSDTATASGTFNDSASSSASDTDSATVTGHVCTITVTKSAGNADVCNGSSVGYTIKVTNNSDKFTWTGTVTDTINGTLDSSLTLAPGASQTYTPSHAITGTVGDTVTASGTFNDPAASSASDTASATVTGHVCTISVTKSAGNADVCNGSSVTYTIKVTNNSDKFTWTGTVTDTVNGTLDSSLTLAPGASQTYTPSHAVTGTVSDTATASGTFNDPATSSASDTASATVTGHVCTITVTKSAGNADVCNGSSVTYTIKVTNNSDKFTWTGTVTDTVNGTLDSNLVLAPGASQTYTPSHSVTGTVGDTVTASGTFSDSASSSASDTASATVTGHVCTISVTKSPSQASVCNGQSVTYTIKVTNNSDKFSWTGSVTDTINGTLASSLTLAPGASQTYTPSHSITGTVTDTVTASGTFNDPAATSASNTASATVTGTTCNSAQITPTQTTCSIFAGGTSATLTQIQYSTKGKSINQVNPGVLFYWVKVTSVAAGANTFTVNQAITSGNFSTLFTQASGSNAFDSNCNSVNATIGGTDGAVTVTFTAPTAGTYYIGIKYSPQSVVGKTAPTGTGTAHYTFTLGSDSSTTQGIDLAKK